MSDIAISLKNVSKYYKLYDNPKDRLKEALHRKGKTYHKKFYATKNLNLEIKKGEILGIVGKNGSGKSTLLKLITSVLQPDEGTVEINGNISALLELGSGFNPEFTGMQNIFFYGTILGFSKEDMKERLDDILAFADIGDFINQPLKTYSSGMKSRLGFSVAVYIDPDILILDEVLAVGDVLFKRKCYAKMEEFFKGGKTIIYVSHDANSVKELCSRAIFLDAGNILMDSNPNTVIKYYQKYIFAKDDKLKQIKNEILQFKSETTINKPKNQKQHDYTETSKPIFNKQTAYNIENLVPKNTVEYRSNDIDILSPKITTMTGEVVNVLIYGKTYKYEVIFQSNEKISFENVTFGVDFHTEKGIKLASIESALSFKHGYYQSLYDAHETVTVNFEFTCLLPVGDYFINSGFSSYINNEQHILNRKVDLHCFKVLDIHKRITGGQIYLFNKIEVNNKTIWKVDN